MNAELLLKHFERISDAPDAVSRLRAFVLDLAVRGKIVDSRPSDGSAFELLTTIRANLSALGLHESDSSLPQEMRPFDLPQSWLWTRLGDICSKTGSGSTPRGGKSVYQTKGIPFLRSQNVHDCGLQLDDVAYISAETHERMAGTAVRPNDLLLNITGGSIGRCCIVSGALGEANVSQHVAIIRVAADGVQRYLHLLIRSPYFQQFVIGEQTGAGRGGLPKNRMDRIPVALPPLPEQQRIVARVDELMALCDKLEAAQTERENRRDRIVAASLKKLSYSANDDEVRSNATFYFNNLPQLASRVDHVEHLRQTILDLAVQGRLEKQYDAEGDAANSLQLIEKERGALVASGRIRAEKARSGKPSAGPFSIPDSWAWVRIGELALFTEYGTSQQSSSSNDGVPVLKMGDIQSGKVLLGGQKTVPSSIEDLPQLYLEPEDLLYNRTNSAELVGKTGIYLGPERTYTFASYLIRIRCSRMHSVPAYVNIAMNAPYFRLTQINPHLKQQCGQANVNGTVLKGMLVPVPPPAEQRRIVSRVKQLMTLCDQLQHAIELAQANRTRLLEALLQSALSTTALTEAA